MAFLMSAEAIRSSIALAASAGNSASDAKRRAITGDGQFTDPGALGFRQESGQSQPFFQADDAVLHLQRVDAVQGNIDHNRSAPRISQCESQSRCLMAFHIAATNMTMATGARKK